MPQFSRNDVTGIADLIEKTMLADQKTDDVDLIVNGEHTPLDPSLKNLLTRTLIAMIPKLKNNGQIKSLHLSLRRKS